MLFDAIRHNLAKQPISAPTMAIGFMGGVVLPILITNAVANQPKTMQQGMEKGEKVDIDAIEDYDFNDMLF
jgi:hypothetical protein